MNKKIIVYRLISFMVLCFVSAIIKSETGCSAVICKYAGKTEIKKDYKKTVNGSLQGDYKKDFFIIKI